MNYFKKYIFNLLFVKKEMEFIKNKYTLTQHQEHEIALLREENDSLKMQLKELGLSSKDENYDILSRHAEKIILKRHFDEENHEAENTYRKSIGLKPIQ
jgi:hypothetical protein